MAFGDNPQLAPRNFQMIFSILSVKCLFQLSFVSKITPIFLTDLLLNLTHIDSISSTWFLEVKRIDSLYLVLYFCNYLYGYDCIDPSDS